MTDIKDLGPLDYRVAITDTSGRPSPEFQRRWNTQRVNNGIFVSTTGTPTIGALAYFSDNASITSGNLSGDISTTNTLVTTLATVNANVGTFGDATHTSQITLNAKGLATAATSVAIPNFTSSTAGFAPASGGGTTNFLRADGTWAVAGSGTVTHTSGALTSGQLIVGNGSGDIKVGDLSGDVSTSGSGVTTIGALKVATGMIQANAVTLAKVAQGTALSVLGVTGNATANYADIVAGSDKQVLRRSGTSVGFGSIDLSSSAAVAGNLPTANLNSGTSASSSTYWRGDGTWATPGSGGGSVVSLVSSQTVSGVSSVTFPVSPGFDYEIVGAGINITSGGTANVIVQVGTGAGPTWDTGGNYYWVHFGGLTDTGSAVSSMNICTNLTAARTDNFNFATKGLNAVTNPLALFEGFFTFSLHGTMALYVQTATVTGIRVLLSTGGNFGGTFKLYSTSQ